MVRAISKLAALLSIALILGVAWAQDDAGAADQGEQAQLEEAQSRLEDARRRLEQAAREVARLSAQRAGPQMGSVFVSPGDFTRPLLGLNIDDSDAGVRVVGVTPNGAADEAGVRSGDVIVAIDDSNLTDGAGPRPTRRLLRYLAGVDVGDTVRLAVIRDGAQIDVDVVTRESSAGVYMLGGPGRFNVPVAVAGGRPWPVFDVNRGGDTAAFFFNPGLVTGPWRSMELVELTAELGAYFGTDVGLLVVRAPSNEALGLVDGDVILEIGGRAPTSAEHAIRILASFEPGEELELRIMRQRRRQTLAVELD